MPKKRLTVPFVEKVKPPTDKNQEDYFDTVLPAFLLRIGKKSKTYCVMVRVLTNGAWPLRRVKLGTTRELSLTEARLAAREAIEKAAAGENPADVRSARRAAMENQSRDTFGAVWPKFLPTYRTRSNRKPSAKTLDELRKLFSSKRLSAWQAKPVSSIKKHDVLNLIDDLITDGREVAANRYLLYLQMLFAWAMDRGYVTENPAAEIKRRGAEQSRERVLGLDELETIWRATAPTQANKGDLFASILKVLILTGQRRGEVAEMRWSEVDFDRELWSLPGSRTKNHRDHLVPLSAPVIEILTERKAEQAAMRMRTDLVYTSTGERPFSGWSKSKSRLDGRAQLTKSWTLHDCRRTAVTRMAEDLRIPPHIIEATINHASGFRGGVAGTYNRALYLDERREALNTWANYVLRVVGELEADNIVEMHG